MLCPHLCPLSRPSSERAAGQCFLPPAAAPEPAFFGGTASPQGRSERPGHRRTIPAGSPPEESSAFFHLHFSPAVRATERTIPGRLHRCKPDFARTAHAAGHPESSTRRH